MRYICAVLLGFISFIPTLSQAQNVTKIMQYNLQGNVSFPDKGNKMAMQILRHLPDFLMTQETTLGGVNFLQTSLDKLNTPYKIALGPINDVAIFYNVTKWKLVNSATYSNKMTPDYQTAPSKGKAIERILIMAKFLPIDGKGNIMPNGKPIILYTSHWCVAWGWAGNSYACANAALNPTKPDQANAAHLRDAMMLVNIINDAAIIFTGDLNVHDDKNELGLSYTDDSPAIKYLSVSMTEGYRALNQDRAKMSYTGATWGTSKLDFVFTQKSFDAQFNLTPITSVVDNETYSDHKPVIVTYTDNGKIPPVPEVCEVPLSIEKKYDPIQGSFIQWINQDVNKSFEMVGWNNQPVPGNVYSQHGNQYTFIDHSTINIPSGKFTYYLKTSCKDPDTKIISGTNVSEAIDIYK
jgi:hypothetical protein